MRLLVTRPAADAAPLAVVLTAAGHSVLVDPVIDIVATAAAPPQPSQDVILVFTSANGVRAWCAKSADRDARVFAVGDHTAAVARVAGFHHVESAAGDVRQLIDRIGQAGLAPETQFLHVRGANVAGDLAAALRLAGFRVTEHVAYEAVPMAGLAAATRTALAERRIDGVLLYSARTAHHFARLTDAAGLAGSTGRIAAYCLSPAVADACRGLAFARIEMAPQPTQEALLGLVPAGRMNEGSRA